MSFSRREYAVDDPWETFLLRRQRGGQRDAISAEVLERLRSRAAWPNREPTMMLYERLLLVELGHLSMEELRRSIDENEELDRSLRRKPRATLQQACSEQTACLAVFGRSRCAVLALRVDRMRELDPLFWARTSGRAALRKPRTALTYHTSVIPM